MTVVDSGGKEKEVKSSTTFKKTSSHKANSKTVCGLGKKKKKKKKTAIEHTR